MSNLLDDLLHRQSDVLDELQREICRTLDEECGGDERRRKRLQDRLVVVISKALAETTCDTVLTTI